MDNGFKLCLAADKTGMCLHILHENNASKSFPQYMIPNWVIPKFFPGIDAVYL